MHVGWSWCYKVEGHVFSGSFIPWLPHHPRPVSLCREDEQASPAGCICGIIPATPCLERHPGLTEMFINDSAGRWDSGGLAPPSALPELCLSCGLSSGPTSNTLRLRARHSSRLYCRDEFREQQAGPDQTLTVGNNLVCFPRARRENKR